MTITVSSSRLYLTQAEMERLASELRQELVCRTAAQVDDPVVVADTSVIPAEAWRLLEKLRDLLTEAPIDWITQGF